MKKMKYTPVPLPGQKQKPKSTPSRTTSKPPLSSEFVGSIDDSGKEQTPPRKTTKETSKSKTPINIAVHRPKPNGVAKKSEKPTQTPVPAPQKALVQVQGTEASTSEESEDESMPDADSSTRNNLSTESEDGSSNSGSGSESSDEDSEDQAAPNTAQNSKESQPRVLETHAVKLRPPQPFVPPEGFIAVSSHNASSPATGIFENLEGKQIWHITAPAGIPLSKIREVAMDKTLKGEAIMEHKGLDYGFSTEHEDQEATRDVLILSGRGYKAVPTKISQTLHLQQVIRLPKLSETQADHNTGSEAAASITRSTIRAPRPQVKGLRMRFFPSGFGDQDPGTLGSSDSENEQPTTSGLAVPNLVPTLSKSEKRKHDDINEHRIEPGSPTKKHKKHRTPEEIKRREEKKARKEKRREKGIAKTK